jgi:hypothetical protein
LRRSRLNQEAQKHDCCQNDAHRQTPERGAGRNVTGFCPKASSSRRSHRTFADWIQQSIHRGRGNSGVKKPSETAVSGLVDRP